MDEKKKGESWSDEEKWVKDSSVDHKGRVPLRASTGAWKASLFIIGIFIFFLISHLTNLLITRLS
ncbi:protein nrt1/ ptr family 5.6 [Phtheirospermum japonicum]|uniref:Protein nrt1/ ptr family 5.6 n=1 Tax=Phtheirospermum japonicum TaxID=374723 RepID=A0A830DF11_9LAMI|nr:protein nrt1/ ptr family 5.6 [Phtheirospermum japonicum]